MFCTHCILRIDVLLAACCHGVNQWGSHRLPAAKPDEEGRHQPQERPRDGDEDDVAQQLAPGLVGHHCCLECPRQHEKAVRHKDIDCAAHGQCQCQPLKQIMWCYSASMSLREANELHWRAETWPADTPQVPGY